MNNRSTDLFTLLRFLDPDVFESQFLFDILLAENHRLAKLSALWRGAAAGLARRPDGL